MAKAMVAEYKADGLLLAPSRSCETDFRNGYIAMQRIFKDQIPTVEYDTDRWTSEMICREPSGRQSCSCISWKLTRKEVHDKQRSKALMQSSTFRHITDNTRVRQTFKEAGRFGGYMGTMFPRKFYMQPG
jgi:hypothetical protein